MPFDYLIWTAAHINCIFFSFCISNFNVSIVDIYVVAGFSRNFMLNALRFSVKTSECSLLFFYWREKKIETFLDISGIAAGKKNGFFVYLSIFLSWLLLWWEMSPSINAVTMQEGEATMQEMQGQSPWQHNGLTSILKKYLSQIEI